MSSKLIDKLKHKPFVRALVYALVGSISYPGLNIFNRLRIEGTENIESLPKQNVLFVSNHQTYFAEVISFLHIFCAVKWKRKNRLGFPWYLLSPYTRVYFVSAAETMQASWLTRLFELAGSLTVRRTWNADSTIQRKGLDPSDTRKIERALKTSWVINFPQGTTKPFAPGRKGTALLIRQTNPIVIPIRIDGFNTAFDKKGLRMKKWRTSLSVKFGAPLRFTSEQSNEDIIEEIMLAIGQSKTQAPNPGAGYP